MRKLSDLKELEFENSESKEIISIEEFLFIVIKEEINGIKHIYDQLIIGAIDSTSNKHNIKCKEPYYIVFNELCAALKRLGFTKNNMQDTI